MGLFIGQDLFIRYLSDVGSASQRQIADTLLVEQATISEMVKKLEMAGVVRRKRDCKDKRAVRVALTNKGEGLAKAIEGIWSDLERTATSSLSAEERVTLTQLLTNVKKSIT